MDILKILEEMKVKNNKNSDFDVIWKLLENLQAFNLLKETPKPTPTDIKSDLIKNWVDNITKRIAEKSRPTIPVEARFFDVIKAIKQKQKELIPDKGVERLFVHSTNEKHLTAIINEWDYTSDYFKDQKETLRSSVNNYLLS